MRKSAQILVTTLIVLLLVSLTVVVISATVARNNKQVISNLEYEKSYNLSESKMLEIIDTLADTESDVSLLPTLSLRNGDCVSRNTVESVCTFVEPGSASRTVLKIYDSKVVEDFDLSNESYFDIILSKDTSISYRGDISLKWNGETAIDLALIYIDPQTNTYQNAHEIIDYTQDTGKAVYDMVGSQQSGFINSLEKISENEVKFNLQVLKNLPENVVLKKIRVKVINRELGTSITIRPSGQDTNAMPNQVRVVEAFTYSNSSLETSTPVIKMQLPLSPALPDPLTYGVNFQAARTAICGNSVKEGKEHCDDGNGFDLDTCPNSCRCESLDDGNFEQVVMSGQLEQKTGIENNEIVGSFSIEKTSKIQGTQALNLSYGNQGGSAEFNINGKTSTWYLFQLKYSLSPKCAAGTTKNLNINIQNAITVSNKTAEVVNSDIGGGIGLTSMVIRPTADTMKITMASSNGDASCAPIIDAVDLSCLTILPKGIHGDCVSINCGGSTPYAVGCNASFFGGTPVACADVRNNGRSMYLQEGEVCDGGELEATVYCGSKRIYALGPLNCRLKNKPTVKYKC